MPSRRVGWVRSVDVIETVMIFALGFLLASLCALVLVPILNRRAMRLARRRVDGLFPMSFREMVSERDAIRAEAAVAQRRMERKVEAAQVRRHADMAALGVRELETAALKREVETRDTSLAERRAEIAAATTRIAGLDGDLAQLRGEHTAGLAALTALEDAHRDILVDLKAARRERDGARHDVQAVAATGEGADALARNRALEAKAAEAARIAATLRLLRAEHDAVQADRETLRASLRAAEEALARAIADARSGRADAELRARIAEVADALVPRDRPGSSLPSALSSSLPSAAPSGA